MAPPVRGWLRKAGVRGVAGKAGVRGVIGMLGVLGVDSAFGVLQTSKYLVGHHFQVLQSCSAMHTPSS